MLNYLKEEIKEFSDGQFGIRTDPRGPLNHLKEEVIELIDSINEVDQLDPEFTDSELYTKAKKNEEEEWADCLLLLLDSFRIRYGDGVSFDKLIHFSLNKLNVIKTREWETEPDENGIYHSKK